MLTSRRPRLRTAVVIPTVLAGLVLTAMATIPAEAVPASGAATAATAAPAAAPVATGFTFQINNDPQPLCNSGLPGTGSDFTTDPAIDRNNCAYVIFSANDVADLTKLTAEVWDEGASAKFADASTSERTSPADSYDATLEPDATWAGHAGKLSLVIKYDGTEIGRNSFFYNALVATVDGGAESAPNTAFNVTGTIVEHVAGTLTSRDDGVPATFKVQVTDDLGTVLHTSDPQTAATDGTFTYSVPAAATAGLNPGPDAGYTQTLKVAVIDAAYADTATPLPGQSATGAWKASTAGTAPHVVKVTPTELDLQNSFVSSVGWVKPGETYPSRIILTNSTTGPQTRTVEITAPAGSTILTVGGTPVNASSYTWSPGSINAGASKTLVLESKAATTTELDTIVWRDLSSTAVLKNGAATVSTKLSAGPKVIPPSEKFDTARYGYRPFPVVPVQYVGRTYQADHPRDLDTVINSPSFDGSTYNLYQEMSLGQLQPDGTVPSNGIASKDFAGADVDEFTPRAIPGNTCTGGFTFADTPIAEEGTPLYPERITDGVYNLPGNTEFYGADSGGTAIAGPGQIDSGCGDAGKMVRDAAVISDPEIDFSDYDTDKDGVVDFFMVVFAGCGGNGASQIPVVGCPYPGGPYDNIWPHSSSLEFGFTDETTGLPGYTTNDQLKNLEGQALWYTDDTYTDFTTTPGTDELKVFVRVGPYNVNPETAIDQASVISHEYGHSLGLPDFYSSDGTRETYGDWNLMASDYSQNIDIFGRQELGWVVPKVLEPGSSPAVTGWQNSKVDTNTITWKKADGTPYTLTENTGGVARVQNSEAYVAKLPGRQILDPAVFATGDGATPTHAWWSESGNDFGCTPIGGHNLDFIIPELASVPAASTVTLSFKSNWDIEWDFDYGFVMTTDDGGQTYTSHESLEGYTTSASDPTAPPNNACQTTFDNGITGTSGSYAAGTQTIDRNPAAPNYPPGVFLEDRYDISDLAGTAQPVLRFSYATDPGLSRPGWFIDDITVTVDEDGTGAMAPYDVVVTDLETSGDPTDPRVYNGGCKGDLSTATTCTDGWNYVAAGAESPADHAYFMEMRDRSGFDFDGKGQNDRGAITFQPGLSLVYTDEAQGYGNNGTPDPPAQSPLDSTPEPGNSAPNLADAAFTDATGRTVFSDRETAPWVDNYLDPKSESGNWEFGYDCLKLTVASMTGEDTIQAAGDLTGNVNFSLGTGCGTFDYGYTPPPVVPANTAPVAQASATPSTVTVGQPVTLDATGSTDAETPDQLDYAWDFGNGGAVKDDEGKIVTATYGTAGVYTAKVTVTDPLGLTGTKTATVTVTATPGGGGGGGGGGGALPVKAKIKLKTKKPDIFRKVRLTARKSTGTGLTYAWNFHNGGKRIDATTKRVKIEYGKPGRKKVTLTVTDSFGTADQRTRKFRVRGKVAPTTARVYELDGFDRLFWPW